MRLHLALAKALVAHHVDTLFGVIGDGNLFLVDSFVRDAGGRHVAATHEANAVHMAHGYAMTSGGIGVATVTHGPGLTNTVTALVEAVKARVPLVLVCGDTHTLDKTGPQVIAQRDVVVPTGAGFEQVRAAETALDDLATAFRRALVEQRPIVLNLPVEFTEVEVDYVVRTVRLPATPPPGLDEDQLDAAVGMLASAQRPLILAGRGARHAKAAVAALAERIGAPVATTLGDKDLFRHDAANLGIFGTLSSAPAQDVIAQADCVLVFGASLSRHTTLQGALLSGRRVIHCDIAAGNIGRFVSVDAPVVGDAGAIATAMKSWLDEADLPTTRFRSGVIDAAAADPEAGQSAATGAGARLDVRAALRAIDHAVPAGRSFVTDAGRYLAVAWPEIHVESPEAFLFTVNFGAIGTGLGSAIGAALGRPEQPALLVCGDGGLMLGGIAELSTAARLGLDMVIVVCNDRAYGAEHVQLVHRGLTTDLAQFEWPSFAKIARAMDVDSVRVASPAELPLAVERIRSRRGPVLIELVLDPNAMPDIVH